MKENLHFWRGFSQFVQKKQKRWSDVKEDDKNQNDVDMVVERRIEYEEGFQEEEITLSEESGLMI